MGVEQVEDLLMITFRTLLMYFLILIIFRIMGKREIAELSLLDLIVFLMVAEIAAVAIVEKEVKITEIIIPMVILLAIQLFLSYLSLKNQKLRVLLDGNPTILIHNGKIDEAAMKKERYNFDDLIQQLREKDVFDIAEVAFAILEPSGNLSVMKKEKGLNHISAVLPLPLILDGVIQTRHLSLLNYQEAWLIKELQHRGYHDFRSISYCSFHNGDFYIDVKNIK